MTQPAWPFLVVAAAWQEVKTVLGCRAERRGPEEGDGWNVPEEQPAAEARCAALRGLALDKTLRVCFLILKKSVKITRAIH